MSVTFNPGKHSSEQRAGHTAEKLRTEKAVLLSLVIGKTRSKS